ncbi:hypothetical protein AAVH_29930 [Aphelenchoides avenae]|nr:hypothetical protein AAVH_29930 [Aphelenchus avenae]
MHGIYGPLKFIQPLADFVNATEHDGYFSFDCRKKVHLPLLSLNMDGGAVVLRPEHYSYEDELDKRCYLSFVPNEWVQTPVSAEVWFGTQIFDNYCLVVDYGQQRIGLAQKRVYSEKNVIP